MAYFHDLRDYIATLEERRMLIRIGEVINKDTELMPLVRWQYRGLPEEERRAFLFEQVTDSKGRRYTMPVLVGAMAGSRQIYAIGMGCEPQEIFNRWTEATLHPIEPVRVDRAPVQEVVHRGEELEQLGLERFPVPISTPGLDNAPYTSDSHWITKDPETGIRNVGNYRAQIKGRTRTGINPSPTQHICMHWQKWQERGRPMEAALVIGVTPNIAYASVAKLPYGSDELAVAGGLAGTPVEVVRCQSVDLEVPAQAEIVIEGLVSTTELEPEGPHGEYTGYMGMKNYNLFFEATCITHRRDPIYTVILSQFPPSESSKIRQIGREGVLFKFLSRDCNIPGILDVAFHESGGSNQFCVIKLKKRTPSAPWQALHAAAFYAPQLCKIVIAVDEDIDPRDADSVNWALSFRMRPHLDLRVVSGKAGGIDPAAAPPGSSKEEVNYPYPVGTSAVLMDATRKWPYPPVSLPAKAYMERARALWERLGLPPLKPRDPWYGYPLGNWSTEDEEEARLAVRGEYFQTGEKLAKQRRPARPS